MGKRGAGVQLVNPKDGGRDGSDSDEPTGLMHVADATILKKRVILKVSLGSVIASAVPLPW